MFDCARSWHLYFSICIFFCICHVCLSLSCIFQSHFFSLFLHFFKLKIFQSKRNSTAPCQEFKSILKDYEVKIWETMGNHGGFHSENGDNMEISWFKEEGFEDLTDGEIGLFTGGFTFKWIWWFNQQNEELIEKNAYLLYMIEFICWFLLATVDEQLKC